MTGRTTDRRHHDAVAFPGMNPYFEQAASWQDFHTEFLSACAGSWPQVAPNYIVQLEEHVYIHDLPPEPRRSVGRADLSRDPGRGREPADKGSACSRARRGPPPDQDVEHVPYLEIRDRRGRELVTVIELLSPSNKRSGRTASNTWPSVGNCSGAPRIWSRSTSSAAGRRCRRRTGPTAITRCWSAAPDDVRPPTSGRSACAIGCRRSRSPPRARRGRPGGPPGRAPPGP